MTLTYRCGAEQPLLPNNQLVSLDERSGLLRCWGEQMEGAFRYSFVPSRDNACTLNLVDVLDQLGLLQLAGAMQVMGWQFREKGPYRIRSLGIRSAMQRRGWFVLAQEGLGLAACEVGLHSGVSLVPESCIRDLQGSFVMFGQDLALEALARPPFEATVRHFCWTQRLQPSFEFVKGLVNAGAAVAYTSTASDVLTGVVVVGSVARAPDLGSLQQMGTIKEVIRDIQASQVWQRTLNGIREE